MISSLTPLLLCAFVVVTVAVSSDKPQKFNYLHPKQWGNLDPNFATCSTGKKQSPLNINTNEVVVNKTMLPLGKNYHINNATLCTDGIEVQIKFNGRGELAIDGKIYSLKQMHWHTPSEHKLNGVQYAAELHQVHAAADGSRAVVGILHKLGNPNPVLTMVCFIAAYKSITLLILFFKPIGDKSPDQLGNPNPVLTMLKPQLDELAKDPCDQNHEVQVKIPKFESKFLKRRAHKYYRYLGSLTTPPCDENVIWIIMSKVKTISDDQVEALKAPLCEDDKKKNARPTQPPNGRKVQFYDGN